jgi:hypothetical protein
MATQRSKKDLALLFIQSDTEIATADFETAFDSHQKIADPVEKFLAFRAFEDAVIGRMQGISSRIEQAYQDAFQSRGRLGKFFLAGADQRAERETLYTFRTVEFKKMHMMVEDARTARLALIDGNAAAFVSSPKFPDILLKAGLNEQNVLKFVFKNAANKTGSAPANDTEQEILSVLPVKKPDSGF